LNINFSFLNLEDFVVTAFTLHVRFMSHRIVTIFAWMEDYFYFPS
jgi:hypothetical protein